MLIPIVSIARMTTMNNKERNSMNTKVKFTILAFSILVGIGLALFFSQLPFLKELPTTIQIFLAGTTSTAVEGIPGALPALVIAFAIGISMVVTPCFLPILFTFAPTIQTKASDANIKKPNWLINLFWYSLGLILVGALVGGIVGLLGGQAISLLKGFSESALQTAVIVFSLVGFIVLYFGLAEFGFIRQRGLLSGLFHKAQESSLKMSGYRKSFTVGATLGGALGVGCPFPTYHAVLLWTALVGNPFYGALLGGVLALGRILPLAAFGLLASVKVSPLRMVALISSKREMVHLISGVGLVILGIFSTTFWILFIGPKAFGD